MNETQSEKQGVTLLIAVLTVSIVLLTGLTILEVVVKQFIITGEARDSVKSVYAADTGIECALFWDIRGLPIYGDYVFPTSTDSVVPPAGSSIDCLGTDLSTSWTLQQGPLSATTTFYITQVQGCAEVTIEKRDVAGVINTTVLSRGYNGACVGNAIPTAPQTVERAIKVRYNFL